MVGVVLWDISRLQTNGSNALAANSVPHGYLLEFMSDLSAVLALVESHAGKNATLILRTVAMPLARPGPEGCPDRLGLLKSPWLGSQTHILEFTSVAREVARKQSWHIIDLHALTASFPAREQYLRDVDDVGVHPTSQVTSSVLNIALNILENSFE